jgi:predicted component of type VI protein secretion system
VLARVAALLQTFAQSLHELRRVKHELTRDLGLGEPPQPQPRSGQDILAYLFDFTVDGEERAQALMREFAEQAVHQLALVTAMREGVRDVLAALGPDEVARQEAASRGAGLMDLLPTTGVQLWARYRAVHAELVEQDRFAHILLGRRFAHAYLWSTGTAQAQAQPAAHEHAAQRLAVPMTRQHAV